MATILIVDDLSANREFLASLLRHQGHRLLEAADGLEALGAVQMERPDLVIADVLMPVMDGYELVRQLRLDQATSGIPVVFYTAHYGEREAKALALSSGVSYVLTKPAEPEDVLAIVNRALSGRTETGLLATSSPLTPDFDREHLRILTDKLSEKTADLRTANARLRALVNIGLELASERNSDRLLQNVCMSARELFGATYVTLGIVDRDDRTLQRLVACGADDQDWIRNGAALTGVLETVVTERRVVRGVNPDGDPRYVPLPPAHPTVHAYLIAPVTSPTLVYGWISLVGNEGRSFSEEDEQLVLALAGQVGRIYENGYFYAVAQKRAEELEDEIMGRNRAERSLRVERDALQAADERTRFALEHADVGIWDMDYTTGTLRWSEILESQYGLAPGTFAGTFDAFVERIHPDDQAQTLAAFQAAMKTSADFTVQHRVIRPDGKTRWLNGAGRILLGDDGAPVRGVGISIDVTERRLLEDQYQQAQKMEAIGRLAGGVAHDFNNLLTAILGYCELLLTDFDPRDPRFNDISEIQQAGMRAAGLTRQLLAFSRKQIIEPTLLNLNAVVTDIRSMLDRLIGEDVKIVLSLAPGLAPVRADRGQIEQIILNLAVNARDAMPNGGTLTIETATADLDAEYAKTHLSVEPGRYVALTVTDTGVGMTREVQQHLFEPFFTTKEAGKGTGLGLATVHGIVTGAGGSLGVYSELGKGSSFNVYLPPAETTATAREAPAPVSNLQGRGETVLVVEDAEGIRALAKRLLERRGYVVLLAANAEDAVELFEQNLNIDVLLTDVVMPGASGPELTRQLVERRPSLKVLYMSGYTEETIVHHGVLNPGIAFVHKPFSADTLAAKIREVLGS